MVHAGFLRLQATGSEQGFNTDARPAPLDDKAGIFTHSITLGDIPTVVIDGVTYREFRLDLNEKDSKTNDNISLTSLKLFSGDAGDLNNLSSAKLLYNLDSAGDVTLPLTEWSTGSGHGDYVVVIPDAAFVDATEKGVSRPSARVLLVPEFRRDTLALWTTFHPSQISLDRFVARCRELDAAAYRYGLNHSIGSRGPRLVGR